MRPPLKLKPVRGRQLNRLREMYDQAECPRQRRHAQTVLLAQVGYETTEIAQITRQSCWTVRRWLHRFLADGGEGLWEGLRSGRPPEITPAIELFLREALVKSPREYGQAQPNWTPALLGKVSKRRCQCEVSAECVRQHLHDVDGVCRRAPSGGSPTRLCSKKGAISRLRKHPPRGADVYVEDEAELSLFPTLKRCWMLRGHQRKVRAPGVHPPKRQEYGATDWRTGEIVHVRAKKRDALAFCRLAEKCMQRSTKRKRRVIIVTDGARLQKPEKSKRIAELLQHYGRRLKLRYIPTYSPECMPMEKLWNDWRDKLTHNHDRDTLTQLLSDSDRYFQRRRHNPQAGLRTIGSPFAHPQKCKT